MPITLVTGLPGHGKTLWTIARYRAETRPVFQSGIKDLKLAWPEWDPQKWQELEAGSILIVDEAQGHFPTRGRDRPPAWIEELAKHRHRGVDLVLITQNPMLLDSFVRRLVDRHFHIVRKFGTRFATVHEYANGTKENVAQSREGSIRHEWRYPEEVFSLYTSAELHTVKRRVPARVWFLIALPFVLAAVAYYSYLRLNPATRAEMIGVPGAGGAASAPSAVGPLTYAPGGSPGAPGGRPVLSVGAYLAQHAARVPGLAYTAPAYDEVTKPVAAPYPAACVQSASRCQCYSQQGTTLEVPADLCARIVSGGFFVAWQPTSAPAGGSASSVAAPAPAGGLVPVGAVELAGAGYGMARRVMPPGAVVDVGGDAPGGGAAAAAPSRPPVRPPARPGGR